MLILYRFARVMKVVKERNTLIKYVNEVFKISAGFERLIFFIILCVVVCHIASCFWVILARLEENTYNTWIYRNGYTDESNARIYLAAMYFVLTTVTTVGFGDISGKNTNERIMCIILMCIGVFAFSFSIGSLSSMLSTMDSRKAHLKEKMQTLT